MLLDQYEIQICKKVQVQSSTYASPNKEVEVQRSTYRKGRSTEKLELMRTPILAVKPKVRSFYEHFNFQGKFRFLMMIIFLHKILFLVHFPIFN